MDGARRRMQVGGDLLVAHLLRLEQVEGVGVARVLVAMAALESPQVLREALCLVPVVVAAVLSLTQRLVDYSWAAAAAQGRPHLVQHGAWVAMVAVLSSFAPGILQVQVVSTRMEKREPITVLLRVLAVVVVVVVYGYGV